MGTIIQQWLVRLARMGTLPTDTEDQRLRKSMLVLAAMFFALAGAMWGLAYFALDYPIPGSIPFGYAVFCIVSLVVFARTKHFKVFRFSQLFLTLLLPTLLHISLGGYASSGAVILWAFASPMGALMFADTRQAVPWFIAFISMVGVLAVLEPQLAAIAPPVTQTFKIASLALNIAGVATITYVLIQYFVRERERLQEQSEALLLNILPEPIARRLKTNPGVIADQFQEVTVLFADIVNFTGMSAAATAEEVVHMLNEVFSRFDELAEKHGLEKIKTIGDAYMVVGGLPEPRSDHADAVVEMGMDMLKVLETCRALNGEPIQARIGINTGPVVAGVIGRKKFIYDLWGDAVNTASRMESHGLNGSIQVTESTYNCLRGGYEFQDRGMISIKGKGDMRTYLLVGHKTSHGQEAA
jgi:adenylate cyclase